MAVGDGCFRVKTRAEPHHKWCRLERGIDSWREPREARRSNDSDRGPGAVTRLQTRTTTRWRFSRRRLPATLRGHPALSAVSADLTSAQRIFARCDRLIGRQDAVIAGIRGAAWQDRYDPCSARVAQAEPSSSKASTLRHACTCGAESRGSIRATAAGSIESGCTWSAHMARS